MVWDWMLNFNNKWNEWFNSIQWLAIYHFGVLRNWRISNSEDSALSPSEALNSIGYGTYCLSISSLEEEYVRTCHTMYCTALWQKFVVWLPYMLLAWLHILMSEVMLLWLHWEFPTFWSKKHLSELDMSCKFLFVKSDHKTHRTGMITCNHLYLIHY